MRLNVESSRETGLELPRAFQLNGGRVTVVEIIDQWFGPDYRYCKLKGDNGAVYILRGRRTLFGLAADPVLERPRSIPCCVIGYMSRKRSR